MFTVTHKHTVISGVVHYVLTWNTLCAGPARGVLPGTPLLPSQTAPALHLLQTLPSRCPCCPACCGHWCWLTLGHGWEEQQASHHSGKKVLAHKVTVSMNKLSVSEESLSFRDVVISVHSVNPASSRIRPGFTLTSSSFMWHIKSQGWQIKRPRVLITPFKPSFNI